MKLYIINYATKLTFMSDNMVDELFEYKVYTKYLNGTAPFPLSVSTKVFCIEFKDDQEALVFKLKYGDKYSLRDFRQVEEMEFKKLCIWEKA